MVAVDRRSSCGGGMSAPRSAPFEVWLNVYDLGPFAKTLFNSWAKPLACLGMFHAGVEVDGSEFTFLHAIGNEFQGSGVCWHKPRRRSGHIYRESVSLGFSHLSREQLLNCVTALALDWPSDSYNFITRNCVHFSECLAGAIHATKPVPAWVNMLANRVSNTVNGLPSPPLEYCLNSQSSNVEEEIEPVQTFSPCKSGGRNYSRDVAEIIQVQSPSATEKGLAGNIHPPCGGKSKTVRCACSIAEVDSPEKVSLGLLGTLQPPSPGRSEAVRCSLDTTPVSARVGVGGG